MRVVVHLARKEKTDFPWQMEIVSSLQYTDFGIGCLKSVCSNRVDV